MLFPSCHAVFICDETIRVAIPIGLRLGLNLCEVHTWPCSTTVSAKGTHSLSCKMSTGRSTRQIRSMTLFGERFNGPMFLPQVLLWLGCLEMTGNALMALPSYPNRTVGALRGTPWWWISRNILFRINILSPWFG